ncbi:MAG: AraC family transcriptional regulator [Candidatus Promineifilaceae bacterium]|nr:AraC family transcriptional regulator [Candidatus Promineifilaceae bacterium]
MSYQARKFKTFVNLLEQNTLQEGANYSVLEGFGTYKASAPKPRQPGIDLAAIWIIGQGRKICHVGDQPFDFSSGKMVVMLYPLAVESEVVDAGREKPLLLAAVIVDMRRIADVLLRIDRIDGAAAKPVKTDPSSVFELPLSDKVLDPFIRLLELNAYPMDMEMLGDTLIDEIYYRLLTGERGGELRYLLQQRGEIQRISRAVEYIHNNVDKPVSVQALAEMVHMSRTSFYDNFKDVMHLSPLQYAKSVKLHRAQTLIQEGKNAGEAAYQVGYNSPAQFSREYKRHFGYPPSATQFASTSIAIS